VARGDVTGRCQEIVARCERPEARSRAGRAADDDGKAAGKQDLEQCIRKLARKLRGEESPCSLLSQCLEVIRPRKCRMIGDRCEWVGSQGLAPRGLECQKKDDGCAPGRIPRPPPDELVVETAQAGQHVDRKAAEFQAKVLLCSVPAIQAELASREKAARDYLDGLIAALRGAGVRVHAVSIPGADEVGVARLKALATRTGGTFREARSDDANPAIVKNLVAELGQEVVIEPSDDLEPGARYAVALKAASVDGEHEFETPRGFEFRAGPRVWFFEGPWDKARSWLIRKLPDGHFWGPITLWTAAVLAGLLALLFIRMIAKVIWGLLKKLFGKKPDIKPPAAPKMPKLERPKMQVPQVKAPQPPRIK
jgi:hypothetical protein